MEDLRQFNGTRRPEKWVRRKRREEEVPRREEEKEFRLYDLKDFFVSVPQRDLWVTMQAMRTQLQRKYADWKYF